MRKTILKIFGQAVLLNLLAASLVFAQNHIELFNEQGPVQNYDQIVQQLKPGDRVGFSNGRMFTIDSFLGNGGTSLVFSVRENPSWALRIPIAVDAIQYVNLFIDGYEALRRQQLPMVELYEPRRGEYAVVEKISARLVSFHDFAEEPPPGELGEFIRRVHGKQNQPALPVEEMKQKFYEFAKRLYAFKEIGDLHYENLVYDMDKKEWKILDWTHDHHSAQYSKEKTIQFQSKNPIHTLMAPYVAYPQDPQGQPDYSRPPKTWEVRFEWLLEVAQKAHEAIESQRRVYRGRMFCQQVLL